jgi:hypothetical protein
MSISASLAPRVGAAPLRVVRSAALGGARVAFAAAPRGARPAARRLAAAAPAQALLGGLFDALKPPTSSANTLYDIAGVRDISGNAVDFSAFKGKVVLYVNVASACGLTQQNYAEMPLLQKKFGKDLVIIGQVRGGAPRGVRRAARGAALGSPFAGARRARIAS